MIDLTRGVVTLDDGQTIDPSTSLDTVLVTPLARAATVERWSPAWTSVVVARVALDALHWGVRLTFDQQQLHDTKLWLVDRASPDGLDRSFEEQQEARHDAWVAQALGTASRQQEWGAIGSVFDQRSVFAFVLLNYRR